MSSKEIVWKCPNCGRKNCPTKDYHFFYIPSATSKVEEAIEGNESFSELVKSRKWGRKIVRLPSVYEDGTPRKYSDQTYVGFQTGDKASWRHIKKAAIAAKHNCRKYAERKK